MPATATSRGLGLGHVHRRSEPPVGLAEASLQLHPRPTSPSAAFCRLTSSWGRVDFSLQRLFVGEADPSFWFRRWWLLSFVFVSRPSIHLTKFCCKF